MLNSTSGSCTPTAWASRRTRPRPAVRWFHLAAEQGDADAQYDLGLRYSNGEGVLKDSVLAHMWFNIAGANGNEAAREGRDNLERDMTRDEITRATELARACMASDYQDCER